MIKNLVKSQKNQNLKLLIKILFLLSPTMTLSTFKTTLINTDIIQDMIKSCILAYPDGINSKKREICLLQIKKFQNSASIFNKKQSINTQSYNIKRQAITNCLSLNSPLNLSSELCTLEDPNNLYQKWIFEIHSFFSLIKNARFGNCLTMSSSAVIDDPFFITNCDENDFDQRFVFFYDSGNLSNGGLFIKHINSDLCIDTDLIKAINCTQGIYKVEVIARKMIYNPFFKKCFKIGNDSKVFSTNCGKKDFFFDVFLIDVLFNKVLILFDFFYLKIVNGFLVHQFTTEPTLFVIENKKHDFYKIKSDKCLGVDGDYFQEDSKILVENCENSENQIWMFIDF